MVLQALLLVATFCADILNARLPVFVVQTVVSKQKWKYFVQNFQSIFNLMTSIILTNTHCNYLLKNGIMIWDKSGGTGEREAS